MSRPRFDHCYTPDKGHRFFRALGRMGFRLDPRKIEAPGRQQCRFIMLPARDRKDIVYLELIDAPKRLSRRPGVSFSVARNLQRHYGALRSRELRPRFYHRNYEWKTRGESQRLPGWNYLVFGRQAPWSRVWFTEYEPTPAHLRPADARRRIPPPQPNGVTAVAALEFDVSPAGRRYLQAALNRTLGPRTRLACGTDLVLRPARRTRFRRVVLEARSLIAFRGLAKRAVRDEHAGRPALRIPNPSGFWDIVVTGKR